MIKNIFKFLRKNFYFPITASLAMSIAADFGMSHYGYVLYRMQVYSILFQVLYAE